MPLRVPAWVQFLRHWVTVTVGDCSSGAEHSRCIKAIRSMGLAGAVCDGQVALLELLADVREEADFDFADKFFGEPQSFVPLVRELLLACSHVLVKRLFLWFAARHQHLVLASKVDLGRVTVGDRGALDVLSGHGSSGNDMETNNPFTEQVRLL
jgi:hypothetical protein